VAPQLIVVLVVEAFNGRILDGAVHSFDLTVGPWMPWFRGSVLDVVLRTGELEGMGAEYLAGGHCLADFRHSRTTSAGRGELDAIVGQHRVDPVRHGLDQMAQEVAGDARDRLLVQFDEGELAGAVDGDEEVEFALLGADLGDVDVEVADWVALELALVRLVAVDLGKARDAVALKAAMQRRSRQLREGGLEGVEAIVERQERVPPECDDNGLILDRQNRRSRLFRPGRYVDDRVALLPFGDGLLVDAVALGQRPKARLTMLYRSTDCLRRCGAAVENLAHSASFHSCVESAPSKPGIKHLDSRRTASFGRWSRWCWAQGRRSR
jgi:hypothetical protein